MIKHNPVATELGGTYSGEAAPVAALPARSAERTREAFLLLLLTHFTVDCFSSTLPTIQPILASRFELTLAHAGLLGGFWMFASSVLQLPFGLLSDRLHSRLFTVLSPLAAAAFLTVTSLATGFSGVVVLLLLGGMAVAAFHPHSTSQAGHLGGQRRGIATAIFITAGTAGLGAGPLYLAEVIDRFGYENLWVAALPVAAASPLLLWRVPQPAVDPRARRRGVDWAVLREQRRPLLAHYAFVVLRSIVQVGMAQYLAIYMMQVRGTDFKSASVALAVFFASTSAGSFLGGSLADRIGGRMVIVVSCLASGPLLACFLVSEGLLSLLALFAGGTVLLSTIPVNIVMARELVPSQAGTAAALMMGFGWGLAGIAFVPVAGLIADLVGLDLVLWGFTALPILGLPILLAIPRSAQSELSATAPG